MIIATRWRKLIRDFAAIRGRILMMIAAIAVGAYAVTTILSAYAILTREISSNYMATNPASALIDLDSVSPTLVAEVLRRPELSAVEATSIVTARVQLRPDEWVRLLLFVIPDFSGWTVNKVFPQTGKYPPEPGTILLEREALSYLGIKVGDTIRMQAPGGTKMSVPVSGTVHDPSLAPAWQEQTAYGYISPSTLSSLGGDAELQALKIVVRHAHGDQRKVDKIAADVALALRAGGLTVHEVQVPPTERHPHQTQMASVLIMFVVFALLALTLSVILTAAMVDALLAQQVRQIAVMKAIGATSRQIAGLYLTGVLGISGAATAIGVPLGIISGYGLADAIAQLLNLDIGSYALPWWLLLLVVFGGLAIPPAFALVPIGRAVHKTVREAISDYGVSRKEFGTNWFDDALSRLGGIDRTLILAIRNAFRKRGRLILTLLLLSTAGAMFLASLNVRNAWESFINASARDRNYDLELRFDKPVPVETVLTAVRKLPDVEKAESWNVVSTAVAREDGLALVRTYPDRGHANLEFRSVPRVDSLSHLVLLEGRMLRQVEDDAIMLNQSAQYLLGRPHPGEVISLAVEGRTGYYRIAGVVRQIVTLPAVFISAGGYEAITGTQGMTNAIRVAMSRHDAATISAVAAGIERVLEENGIHVVLSISEMQVGSAVSGHVSILVVSLVIMSALMAIVGLLGLASAQGTSVTERTREFGIMRTIGGTGAVIIRNVLVEGLFIGLLSLAVAVLLALPLSAGIGALVGTLSFGLALPLMLSYPALGMWLGIIVLGTVVASVVPALRAARLTVRETLAYA